MSGSKDQWLEKTGGFRIGEDHAAFSKRVTEITWLEEELKAYANEGDSAAVERVLCRLRTLKGINFDDHDDEWEGS